MFKLIFFLVGFAVAIIFSALNIGNTSDISIGFAVFKNTPVFLSIMISFLAGAVFTLPFAFFVSLNKKRTKKDKSPSRFAEDESPDDFEPQKFNSNDE